MSWFKLITPKGNRRKRAHKKWLKKTGRWRALRRYEGLIEKQLKEENIEEKMNTALFDLAMHGHAVLNTR
jgi:hypothetical protein